MVLLNKKHQFSVLYASGVKIDSKTFRIIYQKSCLPFSRYAVVVSRKFGKAVWRNRAKRIARTLFTLSQKKKHPSCDMVIFPNRKILSEPFRELVGDFNQAIEKAEKF